VEVVDCRLKTSIKKQQKKIGGAKRIPHPRPDGRQSLWRHQRLSRYLRWERSHFDIVTPPRNQKGRRQTARREAKPRAVIRRSGKKRGGGNTSLRSESSEGKSAAEVLEGVRLNMGPAGGEKELGLLKRKICPGQVKRNSVVIRRVRGSAGKTALDASNC